MMKQSAKECKHGNGLPGGLDIIGHLDSYRSWWYAGAGPISHNHFS